MRIVSDKQINKVLKSLTKTEILHFQKILQDALKKYNKDPTLIPERIKITRDDLPDSIHIFMPSIVDRVGIKTLAGSKEGFKGAVLILDEHNGEPIGILNAMAITAFRTALASTIPLGFFVKNVGEDQLEKLSVYGNGLQSYWHVRLSLLLYPFKKVQIIVRSKNDKSINLFEQLRVEFPSVGFSLVLNDEYISLFDSNVIFGCIPSTVPSIHYSQLNHDRETFISIIGSYKPNMFEVDDELVLEMLHQGKIIVDSYEHTLLEAGELIKNNVTKDYVVEIGELTSIPKTKLTLVKIVGLSIMDISVGIEFLKIASERDVGVEVEF